MTTEQENGSKITYSVRELLSELKQLVTNIDAKLDAKAEKSVVENLVNRMSIMETERKTERDYGQQLLTDWRELLKEHMQVKLDIIALQTNKKDKEAFNILWIPVVVNTLGLIYFTVIR